MVTFAGDRDGQCALTWGQKAIWGAINRLVPNDAALNMGWITALEAEDISHDTPLERITSTVESILLRHESLRTYVQIGHDGIPYQVLCRTGEIGLEIVHTSREKADAAASDLRDRLIAPVFRYGEELPIRVGAVIA